MNEVHLELCAGPEWREKVERILVPWALKVCGGSLVEPVLELGPGPGLTSDVLVRTVSDLTAVEIDPGLAAALAARLEQVRVVEGDATGLPFEDGAFGTVTTFTMLHHVPSPEEQDQVLAEAFRVLRPGGVFVGTDSVETEELRELHIGDIYVPVPPEGFEERLLAAGFSEVRVEVRDERMFFLARRLA